MRSRRRSTALGAALLCVLLLAPGVSGSPTHGRTPDPVLGLVTDATPVGAGVVAHALPGGLGIHLTVTLRSPRSNELAAFLGSVETPGSLSYRHFLTQPEFVAQYSPSAAAVSAVDQYFEGYGASSLSTTSDRFGVEFTLPASGVVGSLGVTPVSVGTLGGIPRYTSVGTARLPPAISSLVLGVGGLSNIAGASYSPELRELAAPTLARPGGLPEFVDGYGGQPWYFGSDLTQASGTNALFPGGSAVNGTFPSHEAIATLLMSGYNATTNSDLPPFDPVVVQQYFNDTFPSTWPQPNVSGVPVTVDGVTPPMPGYYNGSNDSSLDEAENSLDLEMAGSLAPGSTLVNFYFAGSLAASATSNPSEGSFADDFAMTLAASLSYNYSPASLVAVSASFGLPDLNDTLWNTELEEAAATGVTVLAASGDQGDAPDGLSGRSQGQWPGWPATAAFDTYGTIAVGGVSFALSGTPNGTFFPNGTLNASFDPSPGAYEGLSAWYDTAGGPGNYSGTEGGASAVYAEPGWQLDSAAQPSIVNATVDQGAPSLGRAEPDIAFPASSVVAYVARDSGGTYYAPLEGTSIAAPMFAGLLATEVAVAGVRFGFLDPTLYRMGSFYAANPTAPHDPFLDVTNGTNYVLPAGPGWDGTTGWGTLYAPWFLAAVANSTIAGYAYTGPTPGLPPPTPPMEVGPPSGYFVIFVALVGALAVVAVIVILRPRGTAPAPTGTADPAPAAPEVDGLPPLPPGPGPRAPPAPSYAGSLPPPTFVCPYCGAARPAEPVRCPSCQRY